MCCVHARAWSCPSLHNPVNQGPPGSSVQGIFQARILEILEWVAISSSRGSSQPRDRTHDSCMFCTGRRILYHWAPLGSPVFPHLKQRIISLTSYTPFWPRIIDFAMFRKILVSQWFLSEIKENSSLQHPMANGWLWTRDSPNKCENGNWFALVPDTTYLTDNE